MKESKVKGTVLILYTVKSGKSLQQELVEAEKKENFSLTLSTIGMYVLCKLLAMQGQGRNHCCYAPKA